MKIILKNARIFHKRILEGDICGAVRWLTERFRGGVISPDELDDKNGLSIADSLRSKHPFHRYPDIDSLPKFGPPPIGIADITEQIVAKTARNIRGAGGIGGTPSIALQQWCLRFGNTSKQFHTHIASFAQWLVTDYPPWAAYRGMMAGRLIALGKVMENELDQ